MYNKHTSCVIQTHKMYDSKSQPQCELWTLGVRDAGSLMVINVILRGGGDADSRGGHASMGT